MASQEESTERTVVKTYVPAYQKDVWTAHAERLDMSQSEFVRTMVQAGRHALDGDDPADLDMDSPTTPSTDSTNDPPEPSVPTASATTNTGEDLEARVLEALRDDYRSWDDLVAHLTDNLEDRLDQVLGRLQDENRVQHSGRHGGYTLQEGDDGQ